MYKKYLKRSMMVFTVLMFVIGGINFIVDPEGIYFKKISANDIKNTEFSNKLFNSKYGIVDSWNRRLVKTTLAKESGNFDCIVLGSSRVMQISSIRNTGNIKNQCNSLLNLGVSGGSIEDISIFSYIILNNIKFPKKVFIAVDPWTLKFGMDARYGAYREYYNKMNIALKESKESADISYINKLAKNLFNGEYLQYSIKELFKDTKNNLFKKDIIYPKNQFSYQIGYKNSVMLPDGSHVYSKEKILKFKNQPIKIGGGNYKISGSAYDNLALQYLAKIIQLYQKNGVEVNFILAPYHPNVFKKGDTKAVKHFKIVESVIKKFGQKNNLKVYGSFFPYNLGCKNKEFFDFMHPTNECLNRINFSQ